ENAEADLAELVARNPAHPGLPGAREKLSALRAAERRPYEEALASASEDEEIDRLARELLARWPESSTARRALSDLEARRRRASIERLLSDAATAEARGEPSLALERLRQAHALDPGSERVSSELRRLELITQGLADQRAAERIA